MVYLRIVGAAPDVLLHACRTSALHFSSHLVVARIAAVCCPKEVYKFARCKRALPISVMEEKGVPLPDEEVEVIEKNLRWDEIVVSDCGTGQGAGAVGGCLRGACMTACWGLRKSCAGMRSW